LEWVLVFFQGCRKRIVASERAGGQRKSMGILEEVGYTGTTVQRRLPCEASRWRPVGLLAVAVAFGVLLVLRDLKRRIALHLRFLSAAFCCALRGMAFRDSGLTRHLAFRGVALRGMQSCETCCLPRHLALRGVGPHEAWSCETWGRKNNVRLGRRGGAVGSMGWSSVDVSQSYPLVSKTVLFKCSLSLSPMHTV